MLDEADVLSDLDQLQSRYDVLRELGHDEASVVYAVRSRGSGRHFAVKVISDPGTRSLKPDALHLWHAHTVRPLEHPRLMPLHAVHHLQGGAVAIAMERRRGRTVAEMIEVMGPLRVGVVEHVLRDMAEALAYLHSRGVVHREVSPLSVFLDRDSGHARLAHFRIDRSGYGARDAAGSEADLQALAYLPPEQIRGKNRIDDRRASARGDLYSLGLVAYAMLTGRQPWEGTGSEDLVDGKGRGPLPPLAALRADAPAHLCHVIERCLERSPRRRWSGAEELLARLDAVPEKPHSARVVDLSDLRVRIEHGAAGVRDVLGEALAGATRRRLGLAAALALLGVVAASALRGSDESGARAAADRPPAASVREAAAIGSGWTDGSDSAGIRLRTLPAPTRPWMNGEGAAPDPVESDGGRATSTADPAIPVPPVPAPATQPRPSAPVRRAPAPRPDGGLRFAGDSDGAAGLVLLGEQIGLRSDLVLLGEAVRTAGRGP